MKVIARLLCLLSLVALPLFAQQSNPPRERTQRTAPPTSTTPPSNAQPATEQPPQTRPESTESMQAERRTEQRPSAEPAGDGAAGSRSFKFEMGEKPPVVTHHTTTIGGRSISYTATTGRLPIKDAEGKTEAEMFYVAYTVDGPPGRRPLTFAFNGGPGSASLWLHMGALGPRKVAMETEGWIPPAPYHLVDNNWSPLDVTDLVLIDAIGTGFSRPADAAAGRKFWNLQGDVEAFGEFIRLYISRNERWSSPLYLLGESYGTTRAAGISGYLTDHGINFAGVMLLSEVLNFQTLEFASTNDVPYPLILPSFTMIAAYHHKLPPELMQDLEKTREEATQWALGPYWSALNKGTSLTPQERDTIATQLSRYTGISKQICELANLRIDVQTFTHWLLVDKKLRVGRLDGRYADPDPNGWNGFGGSDPTSSETTGPFTSTFNDYVRRELGYKVDMPYYTSARDSGMFSWSWSAPQGGQQRGGFQMGYPDTASALRAAMVKNRWLKVLVMEGYYDLATPFAAANYTMDHMDLPPDYVKNISYATYASGHMVYLQQKSLEKFKNDVANFIQSTMPK
jgi:carboxypeptidase C (cathepsin A)